MTRLLKTSPGAEIAWSLTCVMLLTACSNSAPLEPAATQPSARTLADLARSPAPAPAAAVQKSIERDRAIAAYRDHLTRYPDSPRNDDIARRLADLLMESAADMQFGEARVRGDEVIMNAGAGQRYTEAITLYRQLLGAHPDNQESIELLYQLSRAYEETGQAQQAVDTIDQLLEKAPGANTQLYADARFRRAELLFSQHQYQAAARDYQAVAALGASLPAYQQALYKLGWSRFRQEQYEQALEAFFTLLDGKFPAGKDPQAAPLPGAAQEQLADIFRAVSMSFSYTGGAQSVAAYFHRHGSRAYESRVYLELAQLYVEREQIGEAATTWLALAAREPLDAQAPQLYINAIELYDSAGFAQPLVDTRKAFVARFDDHSDFWKRHSHQDFPQLPGQLQSSRVELARYYHARARHQHRQQDYRQAQSWYRQYLDSAADTAEAAEVNFQLAALLYENARYREAIDEYENTAWVRQQHPLSRQAGQALLHAYAQYLQQPGIVDREAVSRRATASALRFVSAYPHSPDAPAILAKAGADLLEQKRYQQAIDLGTQLLERESSLPAALIRTASTIQAQAAFGRGDYTAAETSYRRSLRLTAEDDPRKPALDKGLASSIYKQAGQQVKSQPQQAAALYLKAAQATADTSIQPQARYDAGSALLAAGNWQQAATVFEQFRESYPGHPLQVDVTRKLAYAYDQGGRSVEAAEQYLQLAKQGRGDARLQREALQRAAEIYRQAGREREAIGTLELYLRRFPKPADEAVEAMQQLADLESAAGRAARRQYWLQQIIRLDSSDRSGRSRWFAAQAALEQAQGRLDAFQEIGLVEPLQKSLKRKLRAMKKALGAFEAAMDYDIARVSSAATYGIASMYDQLSQELRASERPRNLGKEALLQYELLLEEQASPFEQQAIKLYASSVQQGGRGEDGPWVEKSRQRLEMLRPGQGNTPAQVVVPTDKQPLKAP